MLTFIQHTPKPSCWEEGQTWHWNESTVYDASSYTSIYICILSICTEGKSLQLCMCRGNHFIYMNTWHCSSIEQLYSIISSSLQRQHAFQESHHGPMLQLLFLIFHKDRKCPSSQSCLDGLCSWPRCEGTTADLHTAKKPEVALNCAAEYLQHEKTARFRYSCWQPPKQACKYVPFVSSHSSRSAHRPTRTVPHHL